MSVRLAGRFQINVLDLAAAMSESILSHDTMSTGAGKRSLTAPGMATINTQGRWMSAGVLTLSGPANTFFKARLRKERAR
jgi:hypothetical protein